LRPLLLLLYNMRQSYGGPTLPRELRDQFGGAFVGFEGRQGTNISQILPTAAKKVVGVMGSRAAEIGVRPIA
jgi:hypothetical protein